MIFLHYAFFNIGYNEFLLASRISIQFHKSTVSLPNTDAIEHMVQSLSYKYEHRPRGARNVCFSTRLSFANLVFGQRVIEMLVRVIFRDQDGRYSFSDGYLNKRDKKDRKRKNHVSTN